MQAAAQSQACLLVPVPATQAGIRGPTDRLSEKSSDTRRPENNLDIRTNNARVFLETAKNNFQDGATAFIQASLEIKHGVQQFSRGGYAAAPKTGFNRD